MIFPVFSSLSDLRGSGSSESFVKNVLRRRSLYPAELRRLVHNGASGLEACKQFLIIAVQTLCGKGQIDRTNGS